MNVVVKRVDAELPLPKYETAGAAGFDFLARTNVTIRPRHIELVPGNLIIAIPDGYMLGVFSRSSTPHKKGLQMPHGVGVIDSDFRGPEDEIWIQMMNFTDNEVKVKRGEKIAQGIFIPMAQAAWVEVDEMVAPTRGGRGSTGGYGV